MSEVEFVLDKSSSVPLQTQLAEQVRIWLLLGRLREGDLLPSIRDTERELDVGRSIVWAAYKELQEEGLVVSHERSRARVSNHQQAGTKDTQLKIKACQALSENLLTALKRQGIAASSFLRFFANRVRESESAQMPIGAVDDSTSLAQDFANEIHGIIGSETIPLRYADLQNDPQLFKRVRCLITTFWFSGLCKLAEPHGVPVFYVSADWSQQTLDEIRSAPAGSKILLAFHEQDLPHSGVSFLKDLQRTFRGSGKSFETAAISDPKKLERLAKSKKYGLIFVGNPVWDTLPESIRKLPRLRRPVITLNRMEVEGVKSSLGHVF
jgi:GntR family transcriptional regulator